MQLVLQCVQSRVSSQFCIEGHFWRLNSVCNILNYQSTHIHAIGCQHKCFTSLRTLHRTQAWPSDNSVCAYEPSYSETSADVRNVYKLLYQVQSYVGPKRYVKYHLECTAPKLNGGYTSNDVHHGTRVRNDVKRLCLWVHIDYYLLSAAIMEGRWWL